MVATECVVLWAGKTSTCHITQQYMDSTLDTRVFMKTRLAAIVGTHQ